MITKLDIENFKDIGSLSLKDLKPLTLLSGKNNIGKTTILEAIILLFNYRLSSLLVPALGNRMYQRGYGAELTFDYAVMGIFNGYDLNKLITIKTDDDELNLKIIRYNMQFKDKHKFLSSVTTDTDGLSIEYKQNSELYYTSTPFKNSIRDNEYEYEWRLRNQDDFVRMPKLYPVVLINEFGELLKADDFTQMIRKSWKESPIVREFNNLRVNHRELITQYLIPALELLNPEIENIELGSEPLANQESRIELIMKGKNKPIPLSSLGHGVKRLFNIILGAISAKDGILLIDEIENGIHYSIIEDMWNLIFNLAQANNCQIIATTHSWECSSYIVNQPKQHQELFSFVNIARLKNGELLSATYNFEQFAYAIETNSELR